MFGVSARALYDYWYTGTLSAFVRRARLQSTTTPDCDGWYPVTHAVDASTYCYRAYFAAMALVKQHVANGEHWILYQKTKGNRPNGWTLLHLACDGSDKGYQRHDLVNLLLASGIDVNSETPKGQTPYLLASASGCVSCAEMLDRWHANPYITPPGQAGAYQRAWCSSKQMANYLRKKHPGLRSVQWVKGREPGKGGGRGSLARSIRYAMHDQSLHGKLTNHTGPRYRDNTGTPYGRR